MNWYLDVLKKYATFSGRARRKEYWMFSLFHFIFAFVCGFLDGLLGFISYETGLGILSSLYILATFLPSLAVLVRRLHDTDRSGWWVLMGIIPLIGPIVLLVFACLDSKVGENRFGPNPKELS